MSALFDSSKDINVTDHTSVSVYFGDLVSTHYRKDIYQNWLSLLGNLKYMVVNMRLNNRPFSIFSLFWWYTWPATRFQFCCRIRNDLFFHSSSVIRSICQEIIVGKHFTEQFSYKNSIEWMILTLIKT